MATAKHAKNRLLNAVSEAIAALRRALEVSETNDLSDEASVIEERISDLVNLSNQVEQI